MNSRTIVIPGLHQLYYFESLITDYSPFLRVVGEFLDATDALIEMIRQNKPVLRGEALEFIERFNLNVVVFQANTRFHLVDCVVLKLLEIDLSTKLPEIETNTIFYANLNSELEEPLLKGAWTSVLAAHSLLFNSTLPSYSDQYIKENSESIEEKRNFHFSSSFFFLDEQVLKHVSDYSTGNKSLFLEDKIVKAGQIKAFAFPICKSKPGKLTEVKFFQSNERVFYQFYCGSLVQARESDVIVFKILEKFYSPRLKPLLSSLQDKPFLDNPSLYSIFASRSEMVKYLVSLEKEGKLPFSSIPKSVWKTMKSSQIAEFAASLREFTFPIMIKFDSDSEFLSHFIGVVPSPELLYQFEASLLKKIGDTAVTVVIQEYKVHFSTLVKVFLMGKEVFVCTRKSLPPISKGDKAILAFHTSELNSLSDCKPELKEEKLAKTDLGQEALKISELTGKQLLGFDYVVEESTGQYFLIDLNHFPKYSEVPDFKDKLDNLVIAQVSN